MTLVGVHIDSWENGTQNWTPLMRKEFRRRRGYDLLPFLPALSGRIVGSTEITERFFHMNAISSAVGLKVDFDMALLVLASGLYRLVAQRMRGCGDAQARQIFRDLINMPADAEIGEKEVSVSFHRRAHLPIILASDLVEKPVAVPWWNGVPLRLTTYNGPKT